MTAPREDVLRAACVQLAERDAALAKAYAEIGLPAWRSAAPSFATLARLVVFQQISTRAGAAIWARVEALGPDLEPVRFGGLDDVTLRGCGLSGQKIAHMRAIALAIAAGDLDPAGVIVQPAEEARATLLAVRGIGPWTADLYLLYAGGLLDAFPPGDVGLMESHRLLRGAGARLDRAAFTAEAHAWRPWRGVAAHLLWGYINALRLRDKKVSRRCGNVINMSR